MLPAHEFNHEAEHREINRRSDANRQRLLDLATEYHALANRLNALEDHFDTQGIIVALAESLYELAVALEVLAGEVRAPHLLSSTTTIIQEAEYMTPTPPSFPTVDDMHAAIRTAVTHEVRQQMTVYGLNVDQLNRDMVTVKWTLYGNESAGDTGLVKSVKGMNTKLDTLVDLSEARANQWKGIQIALAIVGTLSALPAIQILGGIVKAVAAQLP